MATNEETNAAGTDTRPPMLVENDYESWKIRIHRYIRGKPNGKLIWKSIQNGPTPHPMVTDPPPANSTVMPAPRKKLDSEFNDEENKLEMADTQAEIILSQGLPRHIFNILNQTSTAKEIWDNVEMLMQGSGRTLQQRKEDLFDEYERFRAIGNESIHDYFVRFHKLVNDMKITQLEIPTHQMNTKFVNNLPAYWGRHVIPFHHFINNDLEYLRGGESSRKYSTSVTKTTAADYGHIKWIEDLVPNSMWSQMIVKYDKFALWGISHWGKKRRQFYAFATTRESARDVYSKRRIIAVTKVEIVEWHNYKHLDWITVRRDDDILYKFKEGDFQRLRIQDIEDMLLLLVQGKVTNLNVEERIAFNVSLRMFTRSVVIQRRVEDLQLGVESYQKKLNLTKPDTYRSNLRRRDAYTPYSDPRGFIYENKDKKNRLMRIDELHKFSDGTLDDVRTALNDRLKGIRMEYLPQTFWSQRDKANARAMIQAIDKRLTSSSYICI
ncbi:hypothetical protein Tco_1128232 [Tanacetum coccineum]